jgi:hypothetical protein
VTPIVMKKVNIYRSDLHFFDPDNLLSKYRPFSRSQKLPLNKPPFSEVFMLVSSFFCRSVATNNQIAVVSFAEIGRFSGQAKNGVVRFPVHITRF